MPRARKDEYFDKRETRSAAARRRAQLLALRKLIAHARKATPYYRDLFKGLKPSAVKSLADLAALPVTRKSDLHARQKVAPPLGGLQGMDNRLLGHFFQSPGPLYEAVVRPKNVKDDPWRFGRAMWAAGLRPGKLMHNSFSYHLTPAGRLTETSASAIGCPVFPAGVGNTELQIDAVAHLRPEFYCGTPSFLKILCEKGRQMGQDVSSITKGLVGGEALPPSLRAELKALGVDVLQSYGTAELGLVAYESSAMQGMIVDEDVILEIVRPGTGDPVAEGEVGEVVVTVLNNYAYPMIRLATGDLSAFLPGKSPCGRTAMRIKGWMGRADQTTKVKGMFVTPGQVAQVMARHPGITKVRLVVENHGNLDQMTLHVEGLVANDKLKAEIAASVQTVCKVRGEVIFAPAGSLPNDGKVIADNRKYE